MTVTPAVIMVYGKATRNRQLRIAMFLLSRAVSTLGDQLLLFAVPLIVYRVTGSMTMSGLAFLIEWLPRVISLPLAGMLADRFGGMRVYVSADTVRALACIVAVFALVQRPMYAFAILATLMSLCAFCYAQAFVSLEITVPQLLNKEDIPRAQSLLQGIDQSAAVAGPALAGILILWWPPSHVLWIAGGAFAASAVGVLSLRGLLTPATPAIIGPLPVKATHLSLFAGMREATKVLSQHRILPALIGLSMAVNLIIGIAMATGAAVTLGYFMQPNTSFASLQGTVGIVSVVVLAFLPWAMRYLSVYTLGMSAFLVVVVGTIIMAWSPSFHWFVLGFAITIAGVGPFNVFIRTERLYWIPKEQLGRVISMIILLNQLTLPLAGLIVALVSERMSWQTLYVTVTIAALFVFVIVQHRIRQDTRTR